jgi:hypothetical protein
MVIPRKDIQVIRDLAKRIVEIAGMEKQNERRRLWEDFNSLKTRRVPIYIMDPGGVWREFCSQKDLHCESGFFREYEYWWRLVQYRDTFGDDSITEPQMRFYSVEANTRKHWQTWSLDMTHRDGIAETYASRMPEPSIKSREDLAKLAAPFGMVELLDGAWDMDFERRSNVVDVYVRYLREKIDRPFGKDSIETVRGVGYRLRESE